MTMSTARLEFESSGDTSSKLQDFYRQCNQLEFGDPLSSKNQNLKVGIDSSLNLNQRSRRGLPKRSRLREWRFSSPTNPTPSKSSIWIICWLQSKAVNTRSWSILAVAARLSLCWLDAFRGFLMSFRKLSVPESRRSLSLSVETSVGYRM